MNWFFKRKSKPVEQPVEPKPIRITFRSDDTIDQRATKIWYALGFVNDRLGSIDQITKYLSMYQKWDIEFGYPEEPEKKACDQENDDIDECKKEK